MNLDTIRAHKNLIQLYLVILFLFYFTEDDTFVLCTCVQPARLPKNSLTAFISTLGSLCIVKRNIACVFICNKWK